MKPDFDDDDELALPPLPPLGEDEETGVGEALGDETDFADAGETVGLDDSEGAELGFDVIELLDLEDLGDELGLENESAGDLVGELDSVVDADEGEYGWTKDTEQVAPEDWGDDTPLIEELEDLGDDYGGAVGLDHNPLVEFIGEDQPVGLPPLNRDAEEGYADDLDLEEDGQIELPPLSFEQEVRLMGSQLPPPISTDAQIVLRGPVYALARGDRGLWAAGDDLRCIADEVWAAPGIGLEPEDLISVTASGRTVVVGTQLGGVFRSEDDGETFHPINGWRSGREPSVGCRVVFDRAGRLWMWAGGALYRSRDLGNRWTGPVLPSPVLDVVLDQGNVVVLCASQGQLEVLRCRDDGLAFEALAPSVERGEGAARLAVDGDRILIARESDIEGPSCWTGRWTHLTELTGCHLPCWLDGEAAGALHLAGRDRGVVVRVGDEPATVADLHQTFGITPLRLRDVGADQRVHAILVEPETIWVACGVGVIRVEGG